MENKAFKRGKMAATMNLWNRTINVVFLALIALMSVSCDTRQEKFINATRQSANAELIRKAVVPLFNRYHYEDNIQHDTDFPTKAIPEEIKSLPLFTFLPRDEVFILASWESTNGDALLFYSGSGFGHWGIAVCKDENDRQLDNTHGYTYWKSGIYFYDGN
jgi:hypothetical protein